MTQSTASAGDRRRWLVLTVGRSGSSLLCAIMADAGADFGLAAPADWEPHAGEMEDSGMRAAAHELRRAWDAGEAGEYLLSPRLESAWRFRRGRRRLAGALRRARCFKAADLDLAVQPAFALGYEPRVILSYRRPGPTLESLLAGRKRSPPDRLVADYLRVYRQGLALLQAFGGCAVSYEELIDPQASAWCAALAECAGLNAAALAAARQRRLKVAAVPELAPGAYSEAEALYATLLEWRGVARPAAAPVARKRAGRETAAA